MKVPFVDLKREASFCFEDLSSSFERVILSGNYINGPSVVDLESSVADYLKVDHCISVGNGSDALVFILRSLSVGPGDEVICPGNSFIATSWAIRAVGATPVFCDISDDLLFSTTSFNSCITSKTRAFIPVHLTGRVCDLGSIRDICASHSIHVIEDSAQSFGAFDSSGAYTGSLGIASAFSLHPLKNFAIYGDGGLITTNDADLAKHCRLLRNHGLENRDLASLWGYNSRLDELQAAFALVKLKHIESWSNRYVQIARLYDKLLLTDICKPLIRDKYRDVYHNYVIRVPSSSRDSIQNQLLDLGIETKVHYPIPLHKQPCYTSEYGDVTSLPSVEAFSSQMISLPIYPLLHDSEVEYVAHCLNQVYALTSHA